MRLSGLDTVILLVATLFFVSTLFAQHTSGGTSGSSSTTSYTAPAASHETSSSSSTSSSGSSTSGASHSSASSGSSSSSSSSSGSSASSHSSGASTSHVANTDAGASHTSVQESRSHGERALREPNLEPTRKIAGESGKPSPSPSTKLTPTHTNAQPEKKGFFSRFRHPFKPKPVKTAEFKRPPPCRKEPCSCPPGESRNGRGVCVVVADLCQPGQYWNGGACAGTLACQPGNFWNGTSCVDDASLCATYDSRAAALTNELRGIKGEIDRACVQDPNGQQCRDLAIQHDMGLLRYRGLLTESPARCRLAMPDPLTL